jgi:ABC-type taurine transport system ATPase subunit
MKSAMKLFTGDAVCFGDLFRDRLAQNVAYPLREWFAGVAVVTREALDTIQARLVGIEGFERTLPIDHVRRRDGEGVQQSLGIDRDVTLDP